MLYPTIKPSQTRSLYEDKTPAGWEVLTGELSRSTLFDGLGVEL